MKGYRTIAFNLAMFAVGTLGLHVAPDTIDRWLDAFLSALVVGNIFLRAVTDTPMFNRIVTDFGLTPAQAAGIEHAVVAALPQGDDAAAALRDLAQKIDALAGHKLFDPALAGQLADAVAAAAKPEQPPQPSFDKSSGATS